MVQGNERRRVAIYCRVSTGDQDNDRQERDLLEYAERADFEVVAVQLGVPASWRFPQAGSYDYIS